MRNILYYIALGLVVIWAVGFLILQVGEIIHFLLVLAVMAVLLKIIRKPGTTANTSS